MKDKINLSWLKFLVGSTSLFYIAGASILSCFIIFYFISGLLAFLILCGIIFGKLCNSCSGWCLRLISGCFQVFFIQFRTICCSILTSAPIGLVFPRPKSLDCHSKLFTLKPVIKSPSTRTSFDILSRREVAFLRLSTSTATLGTSADACRTATAFITIFNAISY